MQEIKLAHSYSSIKMYENCPYRYYRQRIVKDVVDEDSVHTIKGKEIHKAFELRLKEGKPLPDYLQTFEPICKNIASKEGWLDTEHQLTLTKGLAPTDWFAPDAYIRSVLDVFHKNGKNATILDWKTGKRRPDPFQLNIFAAQVFQHYPDVEHVKTALVWLNDKEIDTYEFWRPQRAELWEEILSRIHRIVVSLQKDLWQVKPSGLCKFCPCNGDCPATKG